MPRLDSSLIGSTESATAEMGNVVTAPLAGITVVEMATFISGPYTGMLLADLGAEVIKVERPGTGDPFRQWPGGSVSPRFVAFNRTKRSITLDVSGDEGLEVCRRLIADADVFVENFRPGVTERLRLDYATLRGLNPRLVHVSITGRGDDGPDADQPTYDAVGQAISGLMSLFTDTSDPEVVGPAMSDAISGLVAAYGTLAALQERSTSGVGQHVRTSMLQATLGFLIEPVSHFVATGESPGPTTRSHQSQSYSFIASDGRALVVHLSTPQKFWEQFVASVDRPDLLEDPSFATYGDRVERYDEIHDHLEATFRERTRQEWLSHLRGHDVPCAPVNSIAEVFEDPQVKHLGLEISIPGHDGAPPQPTVAPPLVMDGLPDPRPVPHLGQHTDEVLTRLGYGEGQITEMRKRGTV